MATFDAILVAGQSPDIKVTALADAASSAEQLLGSYTIFAVVGTGAFHIRFGKTSMSAGVTGDFLIPANTIVIFDMGAAFTHVRFFNDSGAAIDVHAKQLSKF